jgi:hypothetical protein
MAKQMKLMQLMQLPCSNDLLLQLRRLEEQLAKGPLIPIFLLLCLVNDRAVTGGEEARRRGGEEAAWRTSGGCLLTLTLTLEH